MPEPAVLVVEDEPTLLRQLTTYLADRGIGVRGVGRLDEAAALLARGDVDVLVSDILLPGGSGLELLRGRDQHAPDTEVILITGAPNLPTAEEAVRLGAFDYLEKPVRLADLKRRVEKALERVRLVRERREQQGEIQRLNALLARKLERSSDELHRTQDELAAARMLAELGRLTASVCHELANPLTSLIAASEFLQGGSATPTARLLELIGRNAARCGRITQMLLDVRRVGIAPATPVEVDAAVQQARHELAPVLDRAGAKWEARVAAELPAVLGEHELLVGCVVNLAKNAVDAVSGARDRRVTVTAEVADGAVVLAVQDSGAGFGAEALERALEPFFTTKPVDRGTGLGLAIVAATVRSWGGEIAIDNVPAGGGRVTLRLRSSAQPARREVPAQEMARLVSGRRLVIAAPRGDMRDLLEMAAGSWGAAIAIVESRAALTATCERVAPDALLVDADALDAPLSEVLGELARAYPAIAGRAIPMASVHRDPALGAFLEAFPGPVLTKPFGVRRLSEALELVLRAR